VNDETIGAFSYIPPPDYLILPTFSLHSFLIYWTFPVHYNNVLFIYCEIHKIIIILYVQKVIRSDVICSVVLYVQTLYVKCLYCTLRFRCYTIGRYTLCDYTFSRWTIIFDHQNVIYLRYLCFFFCCTQNNPVSW
jgi:hypothetical protein